MRQLRAEHHQRKQNRADCKSQRCLFECGCRQKEKQSSAKSSNRNRIRNKTDIAPRGDPIVRRVDQFGNDDDVLVVVAKERRKVERNTRLGNDTRYVPPIIIVGQLRPRCRRALEHQTGREQT